MSMLETLQRYNTDKLERDRRLGKIPSAKILNFGNRVEKVAQEQPAAVPQPLPVVVPITESSDYLKRENESLKAEVAKLTEILNGQSLRTYNGNSLKGILASVAEKHGLSPRDLESPSRSKLLVMARFEYCYRAFNETTHSSSTIGKACGGRDHTTALYAAARFAQIKDLPLPRGIQWGKKFARRMSGASHV